MEGFLTVCYGISFPHLQVNVVKVNVMIDLLHLNNGEENLGHLPNTKRTVGQKVGKNYG